LSQAANTRYLEALSAVDADTPLAQVLDQVCRPVFVGERRFRGLRPFDADEVRLLETVSRGEFEIAGFRNQDLRLALFSQSEDSAERRRQAARVTRLLALLRAHGLIKKIPRTHRYLLTAAGRPAIAALLAARRVTLHQLTAA